MWKLETRAVRGVFATMPLHNKWRLTRGENAVGNCKVFLNLLRLKMERSWDEWEFRVVPV